MNFNREPVRKWFGFTRRERSSTFILLLIIVLVFAFRYAVPARKICIEDITSTFSYIDNSAGSQNLEIPSAIPLFLFDPNTASYDTLVKLGLDAKVANTLINYRSKGGKFNKPSDIKKIYGMDDNKANELIPFIEFCADTIKRSEKVNNGRQKPLIDINNCDSALLITLPGIGPVLSVRIIKYRNLLGGFARIGQLREVYGLPEETYKVISSRIFIDTLALTMISVNSADYSEFSRLPYFERYEVTAILKYRELEGRIERMKDLIDNKLITEEKAAKVSPYLTFN